MGGLTFDTGALIGIERRHQRIGQVYARAVQSRVRITVPVAAVAEWWRARTDFRETLLASLDVEPMDEGLARLAGEASAAVPSASIVDAIVMASAARRGDLVYTSDHDDLARLQLHFPSVRILSV